MKGSGFHKKARRPGEMSILRKQHKKRMKPKVITISTQKSEHIPAVSEKFLTQKKILAVSERGFSVRI